MRHHAALISFCVVVRLIASPVARADAAADVVVVLHGEASQIEALAPLAESVRVAIRERGVALPGQAVRSFEVAHSREARRADPEAFAKLAAPLGDLKRRTPPALEEIGKLAYAIVEKAAEVPEALPEGGTAENGSIRDAIVQACFEGVSAYAGLGKLSDARQLIEYCAGLAWLVSKDASVRPELRATLLRDVKAYRFQLRAEPASVRAWMQGSQLPRSGSAAIRVLPGTRLAVTVDCGNVQRTHWVVADSERELLSLNVDCAFDRAIHADDRGLWLTSATQDVVEHARQLAEAIGVRRVVLVSRRGDRYELRGVSRTGEPSQSIALPAAYSDGQVSAAVVELLHLPAAAPRPDSKTTDEPGTRSRPALLWTGGAAVVLGVGAEVSAWFLYRSRSEKGEELASRLDDDGAAASSWKDARAPMLGVAAAGAALGAAGLSLLVAGESQRSVPWWIAGVAGGAGAGLATWGVIDLAKGASCNTADVRTCVDEEQQRDRGALLLMSAVPLLVLPVAVAASQRRGRRDVRVTATLHGMQLHGSW